MSFGYAMNRMGLGVGVNSRGQALVDAVYRGMGYGRPAGAPRTRRDTHTRSPPRTIAARR
jgi:hypothetical protein